MLKKLALAFFLSLLTFSLSQIFFPGDVYAVCLPTQVINSNCDTNIYNCSNNVTTIPGNNIAGCPTNTCGDVVMNIPGPPDYQTVCFAKKGQPQSTPRVCGTLYGNCCPAPDFCNPGLQPTNANTVGGICTCENPIVPIPDSEPAPPGEPIFLSANPSPFPEYRLPCDKQKTVEFHSLRPYQAAPCGEIKEALYCSNDLIFVESFEMKGKGGCTEQLNSPGEITFTCDPKHHVQPHTLYVSLDNSDFPILGNTEDVKNSQNPNDTFNDARKVNEYVSWYLSGVNSRAEYGVSTNDQIVNYSGPLQKLLPGAIADAQRITIINNVLNPKSTPTNHNQTVVCAKKLIQIPAWITNLFGIGAIGIGTVKPVPCYESGASVYKLKAWDQNFIEIARDAIVDRVSKFLAGSGNLAIQIVNNAFIDRWLKKIPPLPWEFTETQKYTKAYNEWRGDSCALLPNPFASGQNFLVCVGIPGITNNEFADLFKYIPMAETVDKEGAENITGESIVPDSRTQINIKNWGIKVIPPLFFAHTEEVKQLSEILNKTYIPKDVQTVPLPETTEKNVCSVVNVRTNPGDNLFPGDKEELQLQKVEYYITQATCHEVYVIRECGEDDKGRIQYCPEHTLECPADVTITINTGTITPNANEIFSTTVADSTSTFRKIFPKVGPGAPVSCIADIPTVTNVTYDGKSKSESPTDGVLTFSVKNKPSDGGNTTPQLTFPHIGSVYEYFLKGIQTALRPKGYGEPIASGICTSSVSCGDWESNLVENSGACGVCNTDLGPLAQKILASAGTAFGVPAANIYAAMKHEGVDWAAFQGNFTDENVRKWSNSIECKGEPMPSCNNDSDSTQPPFGFLKAWFYKGGGTSALWSAVQQIDPSRNSPEKVSRCNFLDAAYAAAKSLKQGSSMTVSGTSCGLYSFDSTQPDSCSAWTDDKVAQSQVAYSGQCANNPKYETVPFKIEDVVAWENAAKCQ